MSEPKRFFFAKRRKPRWRGFAVAAAILLALWIGGMFSFAEDIPAEADAPVRQTDGIVVLTGGALRLEAGLELLRDNRGQRLLVSGVNTGVTRETLLQLQPDWSAALNDRIDIDYAASNTIGNAAETADWVTRNSFTSIQLVTANYHMRRSLLELSAAMPDIEIIPHPVFPREFRAEAWWRWPGTAALIFSEYNKFLMARFRLFIADQIRQSEAP